MGGEGQDPPHQPAGPGGLGQDEKCLCGGLPFHSDFPSELTGHRTPRDKGPQGEWDPRKVAERDWKAPSPPSASSQLSPLRKGSG